MVFGRWRTPFHRRVEDDDVYSYSLVLLLHDDGAHTHETNTHSNTKSGSKLDYWINYYIYTRKK